MAMPLTLRQIRYFIAVAETGKIAAAASSVGISPSAITEALQELEAFTGVPLVTRHRRGVRLTYDGYRFLQHSQNILAAVSNATYALSKSHTGFSGRLTLGATVTVAGYFLASPLARFRRTFPHIKVQVQEHSRAIVERQLANGQLDVALILVSNLLNSEEIAAEVLVRSKRRLWTASNHPLLEKDEVTLADIAEEPYIQLMIDEAGKSHLAFWERHGLRPRIVFRTESVEAVRSLVATGAGVTILSDMVYRPWSLEGDRIESKDVVDEIPTMDVGLARKRDTDIDDRVKAFIDFCRMEYTSGRPRMAVD